MIRIPKALFPERVSILLFTELVIAFVCFLSGAAIFAGQLAFEQGGLIRIIIAAFSVILGGYLNGLYRDLRWTSRVSLVLHLSSVFGIALLIQGLVSYAGIGLELPRMAMLGGAAINFVIMAIWRVSYVVLLNRVFATDRVLFLGASEMLQEIAEGIAKRPLLGFKVVGYLSDDHRPGAMLEGAPVFGGTAALEEAIRVLAPKRLIVDDQRDFPVPVLIRARRHGVILQDAATAYEIVWGRICSRTFRPSQIIFADELAQRPTSLALQSVYTNLVALAAYVISLPVLVLASLAIRLTSRGPALLTEQYAGFNGIPFAASRLRCTVQGDPTRATRVGAVIRALHLEFLPRVVNLVRGEMAIVGPEPQRIEFAEELSAHIPYYRQRQVVKPGFTGWTQIQEAPGLARDALRDIESDLYYTKHFSLGLDAYILLHTIRAILPFQDR